MGQQNINVFSVTVQAVLFSLVSTILSDCIRIWNQQVSKLQLKHVDVVTPSSRFKYTNSLPSLRLSA